MSDMLGAGPPGAEADTQRATLEGVSTEIRGIVEQMRVLTEEYPALAQASDQVRTILAQAMIDLARQTPEQTTSGLALPMGGGGV